MKKTILILSLTTITLCGCGAAAASEAAPNAAVSENVQDTASQNAEDLQVVEEARNTQDEQAGNSAAEAEVPETTATVQGPYGSIGVTIPDGWIYEICDVDNENLLSVEYGIQFSPEEANSGYIEVGYQTSFGVCGTGLEEEETTLAGDQAQIGYYDGSKVWDFVCFRGVNEGVIAVAIQNEDWPEQDLEEALAILDSLVFRADEQTGAIGIYDEDSFIEELCLSVDAENITKTGATLVFRQSDSSIESELSFGEELKVEKKSEEGWTEPEIMIPMLYTHIF